MTRSGLRRKPRQKDIRADILVRMGIDPKRLTPSKKHARRPKDQMTWAMIALEERFGEKIEQILDYGTLEEVSRRYGISSTTAWRWRERLGMNEGKHRFDHLPSEGETSTDGSNGDP